MSEAKNIREYLGDFIGATVLDITQHDIDDTELAFIQLMFSNGQSIQLFVHDCGHFSLCIPKENGALQVISLGFRHG